jgi:hypothetical protein
MLDEAEAECDGAANLRRRERDCVSRSLPLRKFEASLLDVKG